MGLKRTKIQNLALRTLSVKFIKFNELTKHFENKNLFIYKHVTVSLRLKIIRLLAILPPLGSVEFPPANTRFSGFKFGM
jgi:hypothetical protein